MSFHREEKTRQAGMRERNEDLLVMEEGMTLSHCNPLGSSCCILKDTVSMESQEGVSEFFLEGSLKSVLGGGECQCSLDLLQR